MNAEKAKLLGLKKDVSNFKPNTWVRVYWGNGDRDHQYSRLLDEKTIKYLTEWPSIGSYYREATKDEIKAGKISEARSLLENAQDKFRIEEKIDADSVTKAIKMLKEVLK